MKKTQMCVIIALIALVSTALAEQTWVEFDKGREGAEPVLTVLESSFSGTTINLKTHGMWVEDVKESKETYQRITLPASHTDEVGKPMLPVIRKLVAIPATAGVTVKVKSKKEAVLEDYLVYPFQHPEPVPEFMRGFEIDEDFYELDTFYPVKLSEVGAPAIMNDVRLVELTIQPFRYNAKTKELTVATDLTVYLDYSGFDGRNSLKGIPTSFFPQWERLYGSLLLNFDDIYSPVRIQGAVPFTQMPKYLIIYANKFRPEDFSAIPTLYNWKARKGLWVETVNLDSITSSSRGDSAVYDVRDYIVDWYDTTVYHLYPYSCYVLLVGDAPVYDPNYSDSLLERNLPVQCANDSCIPTYGSYPFGHDTTGWICSDYFYQLVGGTDSFPDLCVGRWCPEDSTDLVAYAEKTMVYELASASDWRPDRALFVAHHGENNNSCFKKGKEAIRDTFYSPYYEEYAEDGAVTQDVIDIIESNNGVGIVNYLGHGAEHTWSGWGADHRSLFTFQVSDLDNGGHYPVVYNMCCHNGCITYPGADEVMVEAWTRHDSSGAVGAFGASRVSWITSYTILDSAMFRGHFDDYLDCGMTINYGKARILERGTRHDKENTWTFYWIGDPELDVWRGQPQDAEALFTLNEDSTVLGVHVYANYTTPVQGAKVCLYRESPLLHTIAYTNQNGAAYFVNPSDYEGVLVTATNQTGPICIRPVLTSLTGGGFFMADADESLEIIDWQLKPIYPNPAHSSVSISYSVAGKLGTETNQHVDLSIYDATGRKVKALASGEKTPGHYEVIWNGKDNRGLQCSSGVYFIRMRSKEFQTDQRVVLLR